MLGWDTDQFPNDLYSMTLSMYHVIRGGGLGVGGMNFDAKIRRQSIDAEDLIHAHVGGADLCAHAFLIAAKMYEEGTLKQVIDKRYAGWQQTANQDILSGKLSLEQIAEKAEKDNINPQPRSGKQELLENTFVRNLK